MPNLPALPQQSSPTPQTPIGQRLTFAKCKRAVAQVLRNKVDADLSHGRLVNQALADLTDAYSWSWRDTFTSLDLVAGQSHVQLPADFGEILSLHGPAGAMTDFQPTTQQELLDARQANLTGESFGYLYVVAPEAADSESAGCYRLELAPTPAANHAAAVVLHYRRNLATYSEDPAEDEDDAKVIPVPPYMANAIQAWCRATALTLLESADPGQGTAEWNLARQALEIARRADIKTQPARVGRIQGATDELDEAPRRRFSSITLP